MKHESIMYNFVLKEYDWALVQMKEVYEFKDEKEATDYQNLLKE